MVISAITGVFGWILFMMGLLSFSKEGGPLLAFGAIILITAVVIGLIGRFGAWWNHG